MKTGRKMMGTGVLRSRVPDHLFNQVEEIRKRRSLKQSEVVRIAVVEWLEKQEAQERKTAHPENQEGRARIEAEGKMPRVKLNSKKRRVAEGDQETK